ncbi:MAG: hypothetical protein AAF950_18580, partial [Pseudomonadota bacterium]
ASSFRGHHEACHYLIGTTPERTVTSVVTKELVLDGTSAIKERKSDVTVMLIPVLMRGQYVEPHQMGIL